MTVAIGDIVSFGHTNKFQLGPRIGVVIEFVGKENADVRVLVTSSEGTFYKVRRCAKNVTNESW
jgi:hypothetical protein